MTFSYDRVAYQSFPYFETHPAHLGAIGALFGLRAAPAPRMRYLELGCGAGGNLLPLAAAFPDSTFVGIDLAKNDIAAAEALRDKAQLPNVTLRHADLTTLDASLGEFDYVIAHGIYSWVPAPVREKLLDLCAERLAPGGIALVSHNTKPGYYARQIARDLMLFASRGTTDPGLRTQRARNVLNTVGAYADAKEGSYRHVLGEQVTMVGSFPDWYLFHDYLSDEYFAEYFYEFVERVEQRGLQFLSDARFASMLPTRLSPEARVKLDELANDLIEFEQYRDFLTNRTFRFTVLCKQQEPLDRAVAAARLQPLYVASRLQPVGEIDLSDDSPATFLDSLGGGAKSEFVDRLDKAAMVVLGRAWPAYRSVTELAVEVKALAQSNDSIETLLAALGPTLLGLYSHDVVWLRTTAPRLVTTVSERPATTPLARLQTDQGTAVTNLNHEMYRLRGKEREILRLLDGTRTAADIAARLGLELDEVTKILAAFARNALFVA